MTERPGLRPAERGTWLEHNQSIQFEVAVEKPRPRVPKSPPEGDVEILPLTHFARPPRIDFDTVRVGHERVRHLRVVNPHSYNQEVVIEKFPIKKDFRCVSVGIRQCYFLSDRFNFFFYNLPVST